jgi:hypothetical protein
MKLLRFNLTFWLTTLLLQAAAVVVVITTELVAVQVDI